MPCFRAGFAQRQGAGGGGFQTPNLLNNVSFETDFLPFTNMDGVHTPTVVTRDNTLAPVGGGTWSAKRTWAPSGSDAGSSFGLYLFNVIAPPNDSFDRLWVRFYYRQTAAVDTIMKFQRWPIGGLFIELDPTLGFAFDVEDNQHNHPIGLLNSLPLDGNWHSIEYDYWRNGDPSGWPSVQFWFDNVETYLSDRVLTGGAVPAYWSNKRLYAGERNSTNKLDFFECLATVNGGVTTTGQINIDLFSISSLGRIGP